MVYEWKNKYPAKVKADVAGAVFEELEKGEGLTAQNLVDASRPEDAPLHKAFEWDDTVAAEAWRRQQAHVMICSLTVRSEEVEDAPPVRMYASISDSTPEYESMPVILSDPIKTTALFEKAMKELKSFQRKYSALKEFARLFEEIRRLEGEEHGV